MLKFREKQGGGHFASSAQPRNPRPPHVEFRVGQVVKHKLWGYHGVIIGWDETARFADPPAMARHFKVVYLLLRPNLGYGVQFLQTDL